MSDLPATQCHKTAEQQPVSKAQSAALLSLAVAILLPALAMSIANVALPTLAASFNAAMPAVNWVVIAYLIALVTFVMGAGVLGDLVGRKLMLLLGIGIFSCASVMCALSLNLWMLILARLLQGLGATFILSQSFALVSSVMPKNRLGAAIGLMSTTAAIGTALGPVAGGALLNFFGWQSIFGLMALLGSISFLFCAKFIARDEFSALKNVKHFDLPGTLLLALSCLFYAIAVTSPELGKALPLSPALLAIGAFILFLLSQHLRPFVLIDLAFFCQPLRNVTLAAGFMVDAIAMSTLLIGPFYLTYALLLSPLQVGLLMSVGPLASACAGYPAGKLVDAIGEKNMMFLGLLLMSLGALCFAYLPVLFGVYGYIAALLVMTPGRQFFLNANNTYVMNSVCEKDKGLASGLLNLTKNLGLMTGASVLTAVFSAALQNTAMAEATPAQLGFALNTSFTLSAAVLVLSLISIYLVNQSRHKPGQHPNDR